MCRTSTVVNGERLYESLLGLDQTSCLYLSIFLGQMATDIMSNLKSEFDDLLFLPSFSIP